jgi:alpha-galactosidase
MDSFAEGIGYMKKGLKQVGIMPMIICLMVFGVLTTVLKNAGAEESGVSALRHATLKPNILIEDTSKTGVNRDEAVNKCINAIALKGRSMLAPTPPMGWNSWNWFGKTHINEKVVREVIDAMVREGLRDAGYQYVVIDGGWRDTVLGPHGELLPNPVRFPHGIKVLADYAHLKGLKLGLHTVPGTNDCGGDEVGGYGHEKIQIKQFADWGIDFIKLDKCKFSGGWNEALLKETYFKWHNLLKHCGRDIVLSISAYKFRDWNSEIAQMSRTTGDISAIKHGGALFDSALIKKIPRSVMGIAEKNSRSAQYAGNGYWNDPDMLVIGAQGLSVPEQQVHFALWCLMSAPLFLGNDPRHMTKAERQIALKRTCIAIDQDPTEQGIRIAKHGYGETWAKHLKDGSVAILLINRNQYDNEQVTVNFKDIGVLGEAGIRDIYADKNLGMFSGHFSRSIEPISGLFLLVHKKN